MARLATSFILGYHGCDIETASMVVRGLASIVPSDKPYDWLGPGIYFWESDSQRAVEWARGKFSSPAVIGAAIDLGNCLDLLSRESQDLVKGAHASLAALYEKAEQPLPKNSPAPGGTDELRRVRKLDCAIFRHLHQLADDPDDHTLAPIDTVRGMFFEGNELYPGSGFHDQSHVQIAVRNRDCIKGVFLPPELGQTI